AQGNAGVDGRLSRRSLTVSGLQHLTHDDVLDVLALDSGTIYRAGNGPAAELDGAEFRQLALQTPERRASSGHDHCISHFSSSVLRARTPAPTRVLFDISQGSRGVCGLRHWVRDTLRNAPVHHRAFAPNTHGVSVRVGRGQPRSPLQRRQEFASVTPTEEFRTAMRGYEKSEVDSRLQQLRTEIESVRKALADARSQVINADRAKLQIAGELSEAKAQLKKAANDNAEASGPPGSRIDHLLKIAESQARETLAQANSDTESNDTLSNARSEADAIISSAELRAEETVKAAEKRAAELKASTERETNQAKEANDAAAKEARESLDHELSELRAAAEKEAADLRAEAKTEAEETVAAAQAQADELLAAAKARDEASKKARNEFEVELAAKRKEAESERKKRYDEAQAENKKLIEEAQARAAKADSEAKQAAERAEKTRTDAVKKADDIIADGKSRAQTLISEARATAEATIEESAAEAKRNVASAQPQVDLLTKQRKTITAQLDQLRSLFAMPGVMGGDNVDPAKAESASHATEQIADG